MADGKPTKRRQNFKDLTGQTFGRLVAIGLNPERTSNGSARWNCLCACGKQVVVIGQELRKKSTTSCGCLRAENYGVYSITHGMAHSKEYKAWDAARYRCFNPHAHGFHNYGGRGISMCEEWRSSFSTFYANMGPCLKRMSLERINVNGNYEPGNCKWATSTEQCRNMRHNVFITHGGETRTLIEWAGRSGIHENIIRRRHKAGLPLFAPVRAYRKKV